MALSDRMKKHLTELKRAEKKTNNLESELKKARLALANLGQLKADLTIAEQA